MKKIVAVQALIMGMIFSILSLITLNITGFILQLLNTNYIGTFAFMQIALTLAFCHVCYKINKVKHKVAVPISFIFTTLIGAGLYVCDLNSGSFLAGITIIFILPIAVIGHVVSLAYHYYNKIKQK